MPRFLLEYTAAFPNGRILQLPGDVPIEDWPYLQFTELPTITSADNAVGTPILADDGTLSEAATKMGVWEANGALIVDPDASFTPDATYLGKKIRRRVAVEGWTLVAYSNEITVTALPTDTAFPYPIVLEDSVYRPTSQDIWFTPVIKFTGMSGGEIDWTTSSSDPIPESQVEVVTQTGPVGEYQIFMRDPTKNNPGASPRVDYSVFQESEATRMTKLTFRWRATVGSGTWSEWSDAVTVPLPPTIPPPEVTAEWFPVSSRIKEAYEAGVVGSQGQQYQRCRTWNQGVIDETKRGWVISQQDENGCRLAKNANTGAVTWGYPRFDGYYGGKSGGLYLNTDDDEGAGLFVGVTSYYEGGGFGTSVLAAGVYVGDGTLAWTKKLVLTRPSGPGPYVSGSSGPKKAFTNGSGGLNDYYGNSFDRQGNFVARRPQVPEMMSCSVFKTTKVQLDTDLVYPPGTTAAVYADTAANNAIYTKAGVSGSGSWTKGIPLLTDAQRPIYVVEQHGGGAGNVTYQALFRSVNGGASFSFVRSFDATNADNTLRSGGTGIYRIAVAPNGDVMITGTKGMHLSTDEGVTFDQKYVRAVSDAHFFGGATILAALANDPISFTAANNSATFVMPSGHTLPLVDYTLTFSGLSSVMGVTINGDRLVTAVNTTTRVVTVTAPSNASGAGSGGGANGSVVFCTVSSARIGDDSANDDGGVYASSNVRSTAFTKPASGGVPNKGLPALFNVWELACGAPLQPNWLLTNTNDHGTGYRSTDGGASWGAITSTPSTGDEAWRYDWRGKVAQGMSGWLFCPTNANMVAGWTFQTVTQSIDGGRTFQGNRSMFFDGMHHRGTGTGPLPELLSLGNNPISFTGANNAGKLTFPTNTALPEVGDSVTFAGLTAVMGVTINGARPVTAVNDATRLVTFTAPANASGAGSGGGSSGTVIIGTNTAPWKKLISNAQDSTVSTYLDGFNWMQRCGWGTGTPTFKTDLGNAGAGDKNFVSGAAAVLLPNNNAIACCHRNQGGQTNVMVVFSNRASDGSYPDYLIRESASKTRGHRSAWSLKHPYDRAFIGRWAVTNVGAAPSSITFTDHSGHEFIDQLLDGDTLITYWSNTPSGTENGTNIYRSTADDGVAGQGTPWYSPGATPTPDHPFYYKAICVDHFDTERILYVSNDDKSVIREVLRVGGVLTDRTLKLAGGAAVDLKPMIEADLASRFPGATLASDTFADISQLIADPNMEGLFYAIVGIQGIPNLWMTVDNGLHWTNEANNLPRSLWFGWVHPLTGDLVLDASLGRHIKPPPAGYPDIPFKGALSTQLAAFYASSTMPPVF